MQRPMPHGREARAALVLSWVVLSYLVIQVLAAVSWRLSADLDGIRHVTGIVFAVLLSLAFVRLQLDLLARRVRAHRLLACWTVVVAGVVLVPLGDTWAVVTVSIATLLLFLPRRTALVGGVVVTLVIGGYAFVSGSSALGGVGILMIVWLAAGVVVVLTRLVMLLEELRIARERIARHQIDEERQRISRELHDIIGRTLVAASLRTQTALRLIDSDSEACRAQLEQVGSTLTAGQAQLRVLVRGQAVIGLDTELDTARDLFERLGVTLEVDAAPVADQDTQMLVAGVLREAITNMLKHSRPRQARITVIAEGASTRLTVVNDGAPLSPAARSSTSGGSGTGLLEHSRTLARAGGRLTSGPVGDEHFEVVADFPRDGEAGRQEPDRDAAEEDDGPGPAVPDSSRTGARR